MDMVTAHPLREARILFIVFRGFAPIKAMSLVGKVHAHTNLDHDIFKYLNGLSLVQVSHCRGKQHSPHVELSFFQQSWDVDFQRKTQD